MGKLGGKVESTLEKEPSVKADLGMVIGSHRLGLFDFCFFLGKVMSNWGASNDLRMNMRMAGISGRWARAARLSFRVEWWLIQFPPKVCAVVIVIFLYLRVLQGSWAPIGTEGTSVNSALIPWFGSNSAVRDPMNRSNCIAGFPQRNYFSNLLCRKISCTNVSGQQKRNPASPKFTISMGIETYWNHQTMGGKDGIYDIHGRSHRWRTSKRTWTRSGPQPSSSSQQNIKKRLALG